MSESGGRLSLAEVEPAPAKRRFALGVQYDGRDWHGWQSQPGVATLQDALETALGRFADAPTRVTAAGRTDSGVHALGQVVHFDSPARRKPDGWVRGVNSLLPSNLTVRFAREVPFDFHARFSAVSRTYQYVLYFDAVRSPLLIGRAGWSFRPLDVARMREAAGYFVGEHDFSALRSAQCQAKSPLKHVHRIELSAVGRFIVVTVQANAFLHHMVRNLVACLVAVGHGGQSPAWARAVLEGRDRNAAAPTFAADGLYLASIEYPERYALPAGVPLADVFPGLP